MSWRDNGFVVHTNACTHQRRCLLKGKRVRQQHSTLCISHHIFRQSTVDLETSVACVFAEANVVGNFARQTCVALMLEENHTNALTDAPFLLCLWSYSYDCSNRFMRRYDGTVRLIDSLKYLIISVAKACGPDLDEKIVVTYLRDGNFSYFVFFIKLGVNCYFSRWYRS
jgi:hypothetical protein